MNINDRMISAKTSSDYFELILLVMKDLERIVNSNYWLHPEYENMTDYVIDLNKKYPQYCFLYDVRKKKIKIKV